MAKKKMFIELIFEKFSFYQLFIIWMLFIILTGLFYSVTSTDSTYLLNKITEEKSGLLDSIYFSFISATSTGFGDIIPTGFFKFISVFEVIFSLIIFALVTSKIISIKQMAILKEIYDISFNERITRLRSALHLFRIDIRKIAVMAEKKIITTKEISDMSSYLSLLHDSLKEIMILMTKRSDASYIKKVKSIELELILNSINNSFNRTKTTITALNENNYKWKKNDTVDILTKCLNTSEALFNKLSSKNPSTNIIEFAKDNERIIKNLKELI